MSGGRFENKVAWVTGAAKGIGLAAVERFADEGAAVVMGDIDAKTLQNEAARLAAAGHAVLGLVHDATQEAAWDRAMAEALAWRGRLDVLVNNAGIGVIASVEDENLEGWRRTQAINLEGVFLGTQRGIKAMKETGGSIVNVCSIEGNIGEPLLAAYNASKGGVRIFTKSAALHCADQGYPVRINSIHPGYVATPMVNCAMAQLPAAAAQAFAEELIRRIPLRRLAQPAEIAAAIAFLASADASYMTGSELIVDGGYTAR